MNLKKQDHIYLVLETYNEKIMLQLQIDVIVKYNHLFSGPHRCLQQMEVDGLSVDDVFRQCVFKKDEREMVLRAIRLVHPEYQPSVSKDQPVCSLPLVKQFYAEVPLHYVTLY